MIWLHHASYMGQLIISGVYILIPYTVFPRIECACCIHFSALTASVHIIQGRLYLRAPCISFPWNLIQEFHWISYEISNRKQKQKGNSCSCSLTPSMQASQLASYLTSSHPLQVSHHLPDSYSQGPCKVHTLFKRMLYFTHNRLTIGILFEGAF